MVSWEKSPVFKHLSLTMGYWQEERATSCTQKIRYFVVNDEQNTDTDPVASVTPAPTQDPPFLRHIEY